MSMWQRRISLSVFLSSSGQSSIRWPRIFFQQRRAAGRPSGPHRVLYPYQKVSSTFTTPPPYTPSTILFYFIIRPDLQRVRLLPSPLQRALCLSLSFLRLLLTLFLSLSFNHSLLFLPPPLPFSSKRFASRLTKKLESRCMDTKKILLPFTLSRVSASLSNIGWPPFASPFHAPRTISLLELVRANERFPTIFYMYHGRVIDAAGERRAY